VPRLQGVQGCNFMSRQSNKPTPSTWPIPFFAHRGAWGGEIPENTPEALAKAVRLGAPGVEFDLHLYENNLILAHDAEDAALAGAATLKQALDAVRAEIRTLGKIRPILNLELKGPGTGRAVAELIRQEVAEGFWAYTDFLVSAFTQAERHLVPELFEVRRLIAEMPIALIVVQPHIFSQVQHAAELDACSLHPRLSELDEVFVDYAHKNGLTVYSWTANREEEMRNVLEKGADGFFTDDTPLAVNLIKGSVSKKQGSSPT
jgi:glycerophosphoryl diester phosphodiesterase